MKFEIKWKNSAAIMQVVLRKMSEDHRKLSAMLGVNRSFIDGILRGERPLPPFHAYTLGLKYKIIEYDRLVNAHVKDVEAIYMADGERHAKAPGTQTLLASPPLGRRLSR